MAKVEKAKTRPIDNPYETYHSLDGTWEWRVLKHYASSEREARDPYARVFTAVKSPFTYGKWELGDSYLRDIQNNVLELNHVVGG